MKISKAFPVLLLVGTVGTPALADDVSPTCVTVGKSQKISKNCEFVKNLGTYATQVKTNNLPGCPKEIIVQYFDPHTKKLDTFVAARNFRQLQTCAGPVRKVSIKPGQEAASRKNTKAASSPSKFTIIANSKYLETKIVSDGSTIKYYIAGELAGSSSLNGGRVVDVTVPNTCDGVEVGRGSKKIAINSSFDGHHLKLVHRSEKNIDFSCGTKRIKGFSNWKEEFNIVLNGSNCKYDYRGSVVSHGNHLNQLSPHGHESGRCTVSY